MTAWPPSGLVTALETARRHGFLGPGPVAEHIEHAVGLAQTIAHIPAKAVDLGSGAGVPGLILALRWPESSWVLLDSGQRRVAVLEAAVQRLGLAGRVTAVCGRAEELGREARFRGRFDLVTARSFGAPAVTAECGAPFLRVGGILAVTEPPDDAARWPAAEVAELGLAPLLRTPGPPQVQLLEQTGPCPDRYPRRVGIPAKRPLF